MMKKNIAKLLVFAMVLSLLPFSVAAEDGTAVAATSAVQTEDSSYITGADVTVGTAPKTVTAKKDGSDYTLGTDSELTFTTDDSASVTVEIKLTTDESVSNLKVTAYNVGKDTAAKPTTATGGEAVSNDTYTAQNLAVGTYTFWFCAQLGDTYAEATAQWYKLTLTIEAEEAEPETITKVEIGEGVGAKIKVTAAWSEGKVSLSGTITRKETDEETTYTVPLVFTIGTRTASVDATLAYDSATGTVSCSGVKVTLNGEETTIPVDCTKISVLPVEIKTETKADTSNMTVKDADGNDVSEEQAATMKAAVETALQGTEISGVAESEETAAMANEVAEEFKDKEDLTLTFTLEMKPGEYVPSKSLKLDIEPTYVVSYTDNGTEKSETRKAPTTYKRALTIKIPLPDGFIEEGMRVYVKHNNAFIKSTMKGMSISFDTKSFSPYELLVDERTVDVQFGDQDAVTYTPNEIGDELPTLSDDSAKGTFKGWATTADATSAKYSGVLTEKMLNDMIADANGQTLKLYPVFEKKNSGGGSTSGGSSKPSIKPGVTPDTGGGTTTPGGGVAGFNDVATSAWYADSVQYVVDKGLFGGVGNGRFAPNENMTRAMMWTVLARYKGVNTNTGANWYAAAQAWAMEQGISDGTMADGNVTREQFVTMLWRLEGEPAVESGASFTDNSSVSAYAQTAVNWAVSEGIVNGYNDGSFRPQGSATRAEVAKMLMVYCVDKEG